MNTELLQRIEKHGNKLNAVFNTGIDPVKLCKKLRRLETRANQQALTLCNDSVNYDYADRELDRIHDELNAILHFDQLKIPVFINRDPRGYALKINDEYVRQHNLDIPTDWGGYGLIAPDLRED